MSQTASRYYWTRYYQIAQPPDSILALILSHDGYIIDKKRLADKHYRQKVINTIESASSKESKSWADQATFINPDENINWKIRDIKAALDFIFMIFEKPIDTPSLGQYSLGPITPNSLRSLDAHMVYILLHRMGLTVTFDIEEHKLFLLFKECLHSKSTIYIFKGPETYCRELTTRSNSMEYPTSEALIDTLIYSRLQPTNKMEAVIFAARNYNINIMHAPDPLALYQHLHLDYLRDNHKHRHDDFHRIVYCNPDLFDLTKSFEPRLPQAFYSRQNLLRLATTIGSNSNGNDSELYNQLIEDSALNTFHWGLQLGLTSYESIISLQDVRDDMDNVICYGSKLEQTDGTHGLL